MLRIHVGHEAGSANLRVEGKLVGPWVAELERSWRLAATDDPKSIVVDLAAVTFVDLAGRELLAQMRRDGVALVTRGCLMKAIIEEIETETVRRRLGPE